MCTSCTKASRTASNKFKTHNTNADNNNKIKSTRNNNRNQDRNNIHYVFYMTMMIIGIVLLPCQVSIAPFLVCFYYYYYWSSYFCCCYFSVFLSCCCLLLRLRLFVPNLCAFFKSVYRNRSLIARITIWINIKQFSGLLGVAFFSLSLCMCVCVHICLSNHWLLAPLVKMHA